MFPKEHGAYGQLAFPLVTSLAVAGVSAPALLIAVAAIAGFLAHEPLLVVLGMRGIRARREQGTRATAWLIATGVVGVISGILAIWLAPAATRWTFAVPIVPAAVLIGALAAGREKSTIGEISAAMAFSFVAVPLCVTAGAPLATGYAVAITFTSLFVASTLGVRIVILKVRGGGDPRAVRATRVLLLVVAGVVMTTVMVGAARELLPWSTLAAIAPGLAMSLFIAARPPAPARLRTVGWMLVSLSALTAAMLIAMLGGAE